MRRRDFISIVGGAAISWPLDARAQQTDRVRRIGVLLPNNPDDPQGQARLAAFVKELRRLAGRTAIRGLKRDGVVAILIAIASMHQN